MSGSLLNLVAGNTFVVNIEPQSPTVKVEVVGEQPHFQAVVSASRVEGGPVPIYHAEFYARQLTLPLPRIARLHVTIHDGRPEPCSVTVSIKIWPSYSTMAWWWLFVFLGFLGFRWERTAAHCETYADTFIAILWDLPYSLGALVIGGLILIPLLRLVSWLIFPFFESSERG
jgi:hypothetical protein